MQTRRLDSGGSIDRSKSIHFSFNNRLLYGHEGDTLASALLANNIHLLASKNPVRWSPVPTSMA